MKHQDLLTLCLLFLIPLVSANAQSDSLSLAHFDLDDCDAQQLTYAHQDYSEFTAVVDNSGACADLQVVSGGLYVDDPQATPHSCTPGVDGDPAMCISSDKSCTYDPESEYMLRVDVRIAPGETGIAVLSDLSFYERAPAQYTWINGTSGPNNYPTLWRLRVLKNGEQVFYPAPVATELNWNLNSYNFASLPEFTVTEPAVFTFEFLAYCPVNNGATVYAWDIDEITISTDCCLVLDAGELSGGPFEFCVGDGEPDHVDGVAITGNVGSRGQYIVTDEEGNILGLPDAPEDVNFDEAGGGTCLIWHVSYFGSLPGLEVGNNAMTDLQGDCYALSNAVTVVRNLQPEGGELAGGPFTFCVGDGIPDVVSGVTLTGATGANSQYVVTDTDLNILGLPPTPEAVNFDEAGPGTCLIWHLSYDGDITGLEVGNNVADVAGCFGLSNSVEVVRNEQPEGGELTGGPFTFCVGDGVPDHVSGVELTGATGSNTQIIVTDTSFTILGLPEKPEDVDFDGAGPGVCLIWNLSYEGDITGLELEANVMDLSGCFGLSNAITVNRNQPEGGTLTGGPYEFCVDSIPDFVDSLELTGNVGESQWVITDTLGVILGLPPAPDSVDFNAADTGVCLIWHLSYVDSLTGLVVDSNVAGVEGCFSLSNSVTVIRNIESCSDSLGGPPVLDVMVFPNPVHDVLTMEFENEGEDMITIEIVDIYGRLCLSALCDPKGDRTIDVSALPDGHYYLVAKSPQGRKARSVVLMR
ncbi:MAG: T9SS type A sorting domain-containing protein [Saprospiraceae bacterium]|nr:T9SS type A sorting domain-containing protein [Saprospiraceae bacterium]